MKPKNIDFLLLAIYNSRKLAKHNDANPKKIIVTQNASNKLYYLHAKYNITVI